MAIRFPLPPSLRTQAEAWLEDPQEQPPTLSRKSSSVAFLRSHRNQLQTYLTTRPVGLGTSTAISFPGGLCELPTPLNLPMVGPDSRKWAAILGTDVGTALTIVQSTIVKLFEQTGVLLASAQDDQDLYRITGTEWHTCIQDVRNGEVSFAQVIERLGLSLRTDLLRPLVKWQSPEFVLYRTQSWFFGAAAPGDQDLQSNKWGRWVDLETIARSKSASDIAEIAQSLEAGHLAPNIELSPGTRTIAHQLSRSRSVVATLRMNRSIPTITPNLVREGDTFYLEVPDFR